jgi:hypothetical protein
MIMLKQSWCRRHSLVQRSLPAMVQLSQCCGVWVMTVQVCALHLHWGRHVHVQTSDFNPVLLL